MLYVITILYVIMTLLKYKGGGIKAPRSGTMMRRSSGGGSGARRNNELFKFDKVSVSGPFCSALGGSIRATLRTRNSHLVIHSPTSSTSLRGRRVQRLVGRKMRTMFLYPMS